MNTEFINDVLKASKDIQEKYMLKIVKLKEAIDTFESEDITVPESAYGVLDRYKSLFDREYDAYLSLKKIK